MRSADTLGRLLDLIPAAPGERWLDAACGPGLVARGLAPRVGEVDGVDMTPAMVEVARREAAREGIAKRGLLGRRRDRARVRDRQLRRRGHPVQPAPHPACPAGSSPSWPGSCGPAARWSWPTTSRRPTPTRRPGTRRSSACATRRTGPASRPARLRALGERAGLVLERERTAPLSIDFEEWIARGSGGEAVARADRPGARRARARARRLPASTGRRRAPARAALLAVALARALARVRRGRRRVDGRLLAGRRDVGRRRRVDGQRRRQLGRRLGLVRSSPSRPCRNSRMPLPSAWPASGSRFGPRKTRAITSTRMTSGSPS